MHADNYECPPVMVCGFKRPDYLSRVMEVLKQVRPKKLYLVLDAPRSDREDDFLGCNECRKIFESVDWPCDVKRNFAVENMGCGKRMTTGISWVFEHEECAIILEDDCVPHPTFFRYCSELLEKYKDDNRVGAINGHDEHLHLNKVDFHGDSYYFDRMMNCWGWATWRRAWRLHDPTLSYLNKLCESGATMNIFNSRRYYKLWKENIWRIHDGIKKTWAGAWATTIYKEGLLVIHPTQNLISNIGYENSSREGQVVGTESDVKKRHGSPFSKRAVKPMIFPLQHPVSMIINARCERFCLADSLYATPFQKAWRDPYTAFRRVVSIFSKTLKRCGC